MSMLSVVGLDSRNVPVMLWMGANAVALPVGDMVPDEWKDVPIPVPLDPHQFQRQNQLGGWKQYWSVS